MDNMNLSSGDDEFLMQKIRKKTGYGVKFCMQKEAIVKTNPNKTVKQFYNQRKRWASKGLFYADKLLVVKLILIFLFYMSLILMPIFSILLSLHFIQIFVLCISTKLFLEYIIIKKGSELLFNRKILDDFFLAELFQVPYIILAGISGVFGNFIWKGRTIKR
jgi:cellulose synthase/poly-beta-1,6-N-acetylglucosamine synthase-like glycosyltransferase